MVGCDKEIDLFIVFEGVGIEEAWESIEIISGLNSNLVFIVTTKWAVGLIDSNRVSIGARVDQFVIKPVQLRWVIGRC
jgi:hypothetical protein